MSDYLTSCLRHGYLVVSKSEGSDHGNEVAAVELLNLGYLVNPDELRGASDKELVRAIKAARVVSGSDHTYSPMYPNFPGQVRELSTLRLFIDQIVHYLTQGTPTVDRAVELRPGLPLADLLASSKPLRVVSREDIQIIAQEYLRKTMALGESDIAFVSEILALCERDQYLTVLEGVRNSENRQIALSALWDAGYDRDELALWAIPQARNSDDLLRIVLTLYTEQGGNKNDKDSYRKAVRSLSDSDFRSVRMWSVPRSIRRAVVVRLGEITKGRHADRLVGRRSLWRTVMRYLHPYSEAKTDDQRRALDIIHENVKYETYNSRKEAALASGDPARMVSVLKEAPGLLCQHLTTILGRGAGPFQVASAVEEVGHRASITALVKAYNGVSASEEGRAGVVRVSGEKNHMLVRSKRDISVSAYSTVRQAIKDAIVRRLSAADPLTSASSVGVKGSDPVSLVRRDLSVSDRSITRGEKIQLSGDGVLRLFVHWYNGPGRVDLDLSAILLDGNFRQIASVDYNSYHDKRGFSTYSGDLTSAPEPRGATEFIDVDLDKVVEAHPKAKWVAMGVNSYTGQRLNKVRHFAGAMIRSDADAGEIFDPRTVKAAFTSTCQATLVCPLVVNLDTREMMWLDTSNGQSTGGYSVSFGGSLADAIAAEVAVPRLTEGDLMSLYAQAHGLRKLSTKAVDRKLAESLLSV